MFKVNLRERSTARLRQFLTLPLGTPRDKQQCPFIFIVEQFIPIYGALITVDVPLSRRGAQGNRLPQPPVLELARLTVPRYAHLFDTTSSTPLANGMAVVKAVLIFVVRIPLQPVTPYVQAAGKVITPLAILPQQLLSAMETQLNIDNLDPSYATLIPHLLVPLGCRPWPFSWQQQRLPKAGRWNASPHTNWKHSDLLR